VKIRAKDVAKNGAEADFHLPNAQYLRAISSSHMSKSNGENRPSTTDLCEFPNG
jgi:hypothetical protein